MVLSNPIFSSTGRVNSKVPYSGCKAEEEGEWAQPHQQPAFPTRKELKMKEESVCTIYGVEWLSNISSSLSLPFLPSAIAGWQRLAQDWICLKTTKVAFIQSNLLCLITLLFLERKECREELFPLVLESYQSTLPPYLFSLSHRFCIRWWAHAKTFSLILLAPDR